MEPARSKALVLSALGALATREEMITQRSKPPLPPIDPWAHTAGGATSGRADRRASFGPGTYGGLPQRQSGGLSYSSSAPALHDASRPRTSGGTIDLSDE